MEVRLSELVGERFLGDAEHLQKVNPTLYQLEYLGQPVGSGDEVFPNLVLDGKTDREEFTQVTEHFRFDADGMTIQNSATGMGIRVSEEQVLFLGGEDPTTAIYPDAMQTTRLSVAQRLDVGDFSFLPRTNGNLSFRYTKPSP